MATGFTSERATEILEKRLEGAWVGLSTTEPKQDGSNVDEPFYGGYQRQQINSWDTTIPGQVANYDIIFLFEALEDIGTVTHLILSKTSAGAKIFLMAELTTPLTIAAGYVPLIRPRGLVIGLDKDSLESYG